MKSFVAFLLFVVWSGTLVSQQLSQTIRGKITDKFTQQPIIGANVILQNSNPIVGTVTDIDGNFRLEEVPLGRQNIRISFIGYNEILLQIGRAHV